MAKRTKSGKSGAVAKATATTAKRPVTDLRHPAHTRVNNPTAEMQTLMGEDDTVQVSYARKTDSIKHLEIYHDEEFPLQLVWQGKQQDDNGGRLKVDAPPIFVQEKILPQAIIEDLRRASAQDRAARSEVPRDMFYEAFAGVSDEFARVQFYKHSEEWSNRMIAGDSLQVMASLAHKEMMRDKVQCIYMDPPYGIDFKSNWQQSTKTTSVSGRDISGEPEVVAAYRDTWQNGIHSYLSYLRDRLTAAKELLTHSGSIFVQISDKNVHLVRCLMDEVFGMENFVSTIAYKTTSGTSRKSAPKRICDYLVWYAKDKDKIKFRRLFQVGKIQTNLFRMVEDENGNRRPLTYNERTFPERLAKSLRLFRTLPLHSQGTGDRSSRKFEGELFAVKGTWRHTEQGFNRLKEGGRIMKEKTVISSIRFFDDFPYTELTGTWIDTGPELDKSYVVQTNINAIQRCILMTTDPGDLVLDPTCGSGTTAYVAEHWGRRWITCDTSRVALALARKRLMGAHFDYYLMRDSQAGAKKMLEIGGTTPQASSSESIKAVQSNSFGDDVSHGFVYHRVPHVTLSDIANNPEIDQIYTSHQRKLEKLLSELNESTSNDWQSWQVPNELPPDMDKKAINLHQKYRQAERDRQNEIDQSIACNANFEELVDRPYKDNGTLRVAGPFSVESLSPHRILPTDEPGSGLQAPTSETNSAPKLIDIVLENLPRAGIGNTKQGERLHLQDLQPWPGKGYVHLSASHDDPISGKPQRVAVCIGPEYGTVSKKLIVHAAVEAADQFDVLVVLGFAFEAYTDQDNLHIGTMRVHRVEMNKDLHMADRLQAGSEGNLFVSLGEPDIDCRRATSGENMWQVEIKGIDIFNPNTGQVKSSGVEDIACWMIDTDYNGLSFFVRHAYFHGKSGDKNSDPYYKLKKELHADIDAETWETLFTATSRPFVKPSSGKIAVKAINHYGDELIKVFASFD